MAGEDNHVYGFNKPDSLELLQKIGSTTGRPSNIPPTQFAGYIIQTPSGGIAARSGSTVTFVDCDVYYIDGTTLTSSGVTVPVGNMSASAVAGSAWGMTFWAGGALFAVWEDCAAGITDLRLSGSDLQYTSDGSTWTTWTTGTECA